MTGWAELKEAFWAAVDAGRSEHSRHVAALQAIDPELANRLEAMLAADGRGESLQQIFEVAADVPAPERPASIGAYAVTGVLGTGGMGEVYRARDTRLNREVAIKVLPPAVAGDPQRLARFEREAQVLASLNHPHIAQLYGLEESGRGPALVMELVDGPTLAQIVSRHSEETLAIPHVCEIARQIAEGLEAAHEKGIVHRDLKPGNVALTRKGDVKILDFGVAKTLERAAVNGSGDPVDADGGGLLGTPEYMSPEQARGSTLDERTDIWAFGCLLYELLTGSRAFAGLTTSDSLAAVLGRSPDMTRLPAGTPTTIRSLIDRCLEKDPARRLRDIADARSAIEAGIRELSAAERRAGPGQGRRTRAVAAVALLALPVLLAAGWWRGSRDAAPFHAIPVTSLSGAVASPSLSPDGSSVVFSWNGSQQDNHDLYIQKIGAGAPRRLTSDPADDYHPTWSPDGRVIAFVRRTAGGRSNEVRLLAVAGGEERKLVDIQPNVPFGGIASLGWCPDSTCVVVTDAVATGTADALFAVSLASGEKRQLTYPEGLVADLDPAMSPDGGSLVFHRNSAPFSGAFHRVELDARTAPRGSPRQLTAPLSIGASAWTRDGREIVFSSRGALWRLDALNGGTPARLPFVGQDGHHPVIAQTREGGQRLLYIRRVSDSNVWRLTTPAAGAPADAPALKVVGSTRDDFTPALSPDGRQVAFWSNRSGEPQIWVAEIDGAAARQVTSMTFRSFPAWPRWSPDGRLIAFHGDPADRPDVLVVPSEGGTARILTANIFSGAFPSFSRDGRSLYFCRWEGPETRIWKMPVNSGPPLRITEDPGFVPIESPDGRFLYYVSAADRPSTLWRMPVDGGTPSKIVDGVLFGNFDVADAGIYYLERVSGAPAADADPPRRPTGEIRLQYYDISTGRSTTIATALGNAAHGLSVSRDGTRILFSRIDSAIDELMLVEDFR